MLPYIQEPLLPLAFIHYVIQGVGQVRADAGTLRLALLPFAAFLMVRGYLIARSTAAPVALGVLWRCRRGRARDLAPHRTGAVASNLAVDGDA